MAAIPLGMRIENVFVSYLIYIGQMFWPTRLAVYYPYPPSIEVWQAVVAFVVLLTISVVAMWVRRTRPYLAVGWFWHLGTLVPVIGLVQVARRPTLTATCTSPWWVSRSCWHGAQRTLRRSGRGRSRCCVAAAAVSCAACLALAWREAAYWRNSETLFERALEATRNNSVAENNLGLHLMTVGRNHDAIPHFEAALEINLATRTRTTTWVLFSRRFPSGFPMPPNNMKRRCICARQRRSA